MIVPFTYYLHNDDESDEMMDLLISQGVELEIAQMIADRRPFYEVKLEFEFDTETGEITWSAS